MTREKIIRSVVVWGWGAGIDCKKKKTQKELLGKKTRRTVGMMEMF